MIPFVLLESTLSVSEKKLQLENLMAPYSLVADATAENFAFEKIQENLAFQVINPIYLDNITNMLNYIFKIIHILLLINFVAFFRNHIS